MSNLKKNFVYNIVYQLLLIILPLITAPYVSRVLGVEGVGTYSYVYSIAYYFGLCGMLGISNHGNRSIALLRNNREKISSVFCTIYSIQLIMTIIALILYVLYVSFFFNGNKTVAYIDTMYVISNVLDINWLFFGMERFRLTISRNILFKLVTVILTFALIKNQSDLWKYTLILALGTMISQAYLWIYVRKYIHFKKPDLKEAVAHIKPILTLFIPVISYSIYKVMDKIMLGGMTTVTQVGLYENSEKIIGIPIGIITAFSTVMMPRISALVADSNSKQIGIYNKISFKYLTLIVIGMVFGLIGISNMLPVVFFGNEFVDCGPLIAGMSFTLIFMTWANIIRTQYLIPNKNDRPYVVSTICGAGVNLVFNTIFIPQLHAMGALIGTLLAEFLVFFVQMLYVWKVFPVLKYLKSTIAFFPIGIVMCIPVYFIGIVRGESISTLGLQIVVGAVIYSVLAVAYLLKTKDETAVAICLKVQNKSLWK